MTDDRVLALMWEARAVPGRGAELLEWARAQDVGGEPLRRETFRASGDRVLVITWWRTTGEDGGPPQLPEPPAELVSRPVHRWSFESLGTG
ncbi:hypothetical protein [Streptomyces yaizuensis]|uniref:Antibiotic biosynthesis monooxygenase n=1 Tax=Streptomyces yaizuensis TaxID=2989713 RepID=A0ABQ5P4V8_9ACTN|nr:hypothetical protein [Streptomyces sp. YSPA8]GLF97619.1 antibiotic biosynthesis monooxygenase [Streptomyces sp. YSPA8]